jgi:hypothetical protein
MMFWLMYVGIILIVGGVELISDYPSTKATVIVGVIIKCLGLFVTALACSGLQDKIDDLDRRLNKQEKTKDKGGKE